MAIAGTGTQADPWIVHNYDEIKDVFQNRVTSDNLYAKLANDINCNDYGDTWEWETIAVYANWNFEFDLDGHTIKNIMIKSGNSLFYGKSTVNVIRNGKILNVFNNSGASVIDGNGLTLKDISMSVNGTGLTSNAFNQISMNNCAVYFKSNKLNNEVFLRANITSPFKNTDFYLDISNVNSNKIFGGSSNYLTIDNCRISGKLRGALVNKYLSLGGARNSVIEVDTTLADCVSAQTIFSDVSTGIINTEISPNLIGGTSCLTACTTAQMRDADYLNSIGFTVVKVGE